MQRAGAVIRPRTSEPHVSRETLLNHTGTVGFQQIFQIFDRLAQLNAFIRIRHEQSLLLQFHHLAFRMDVAVAFQGFFEAGEGVVAHEP